jgi:hypothetical protein
VQPNPARRFGGSADIYPSSATRPGRSLAIITQRDTGIWLMPTAVREPMPGGLPGFPFASAAEPL